MWTREMPASAALGKTAKVKNFQTVSHWALKHQTLSNLNTNLAAREKWQKREPDTQTVQRYLKYYFIDMKIKNPT